MLRHSVVVPRTRVLHPLNSSVVLPPAVVACSCCGCLQESELTPSGANLLDGRYAVFGYVVEGQDLLTQLQACFWAATHVFLACLAAS